MAKTVRYSPEVQDRAVGMVFDHEENKDPGRIGCTPETLRKWVRRDGITSHAPGMLRIVPVEIRGDFPASEYPVRSIYSR